MSCKEASMKVTLKEVYDKVIELKDDNTEQHINIMHKQDKTNGRVSVNRQIASTALSLTIIFGGWFIYYISSK